MDYNPPVDVALFVPCYVDQLYPRVGLSTAALLERHGVTVHFPEAQTCCGQPMANSGKPNKTGGRIRPPELFHIL